MRMLINWVHINAQFPTIAKVLVNALHLDGAGANHCVPKLRRRLYAKS